MIESDWVICDRCGRRLGTIKNGIFINKHGRQIIKAERATVSCPKCGKETEVDPEKGG